MRLALLCDDPVIGEWLDALADDPSHEIVLAAALGESGAQILRGRSGIRLTSQWEDLLNPFDAILVGGNHDQVLEAIRQLAMAGQPLLFLPRSDQGSMFIYELSLIRDDNQVSIHPAIWRRCDLPWLRLRNSIKDGEWGQVHLLQFQRTLAAKSASSLLDQGEIDALMLEDFDLLRWLIGDYDQVTAIRVGASDQGVRTQSVKLSGKGLPEATWEIGCQTASSGRLTVQTDRGTLILESKEDSDWRLTEPAGTTRTGNRQTAIREVLRQLSISPSANWTELVRDFETVDATHRSVKRRRTIDLHFEPMSERAIFKTQMTAIGCSLLLLTLLLVLIYLGIASAVPLPAWGLLLLRSLIFAPLGLFLGLQLLYPLTRPSQGTGAGQANVEREGGRTDPAGD